MRTKVNGRNKKSSNKIFTSIDNQLTRGCKSIQADKKDTIKKNRDNHTVITSPYEKTSSKEVGVNNDNSTTQRPTMGGKTVSAIHKTSNKVQMSSQELKLLSRRINPSEPLATPHSSPSKPPLVGSVTKKRPPPQQQQVQQTQPTKITKCNEDKAQFGCKHCDKKYKTRNGLVYHSERCKFRQSSFENMCSLCQDSSKDNATAMIKCVACHSWLHTKCIGSNVKNEALEFHCIRCIKEEESPSKKTIKLSELCPTKEAEKSNCISLFPDDESNLHLIKVEDGLTPLVTHDFSDWTTESPCLLLSSLLDDFSSSELLSPSLLPQSDWHHFANFELDFQSHDS
ncbi:hypothetical protein BD770DRAFT_439905 [Pilaira anomala]|nr:hypothetical protein BD770DRAFT_439905 [Pilaira anomala]